MIYFIDGKGQQNKTNSDQASDAGAIFKNSVSSADTLFFFFFFWYIKDLKSLPS